MVFHKFTWLVHCSKPMPIEVFNFIEMVLASHIFDWHDSWTFMRNFNLLLNHWFVLTEGSHFEVRGEITRLGYILVECHLIDIIFAHSELLHTFFSTRLHPLFLAIWIVIQIDCARTREVINLSPVLAILILLTHCELNFTEWWLTGDTFNFWVAWWWSPTPVLHIWWLRSFFRESAIKTAPCGWDFFNNCGGLRDSFGVRHAVDNCAEVLILSCGFLMSLSWGVCICYLFGLDTWLQLPTKGIRSIVFEYFALRYSLLGSTREIRWPFYCRIRIVNRRSGFKTCSSRFIKFVVCSFVVVKLRWALIRHANFLARRFASTFRKSQIVHFLWCLPRLVSGLESHLPFIFLFWNLLLSRRLLFLLVFGTAHECHCLTFQVSSILCKVLLQFIVLLSQDYFVIRYNSWGLPFNLRRRFLTYLTVN